MPATSSSLVHRFGSDATMYAGPGEIRRDYVDKMLLAALQEAQSVVPPMTVRLRSSAWASAFW